MSCKLISSTTWTPVQSLRATGSSGSRYHDFYRRHRFANTRRKGGWDAAWSGGSRVVSVNRFFAFGVPVFLWFQFQAVFSFFCTGFARQQPISDLESSGCHVLLAFRAFGLGVFWCKRGFKWSSEYLSKITNRTQLAFWTHILKGVCGPRR